MFLSTKRKSKISKTKTKRKQNENKVKTKRKQIENKAKIKQRKSVDKTEDMVYYITIVKFMQKIYYN